MNNVYVVQVNGKNILWTENLNEAYKKYEEEPKANLFMVLEKK